MIHFRKLCDIRSAGEKIVNDMDLLAALFRDIPELERFSFVKNQEYDDNNYFDHIQVTEINGHRCDMDGYLDDRELGDQGFEIPSSYLPKIKDRDSVDHVVYIIAKSYDCHEDEVTYERKDAQKPNKKADKYGVAERKYLTSYLSGGTLPKSFFLKNELKWALYYALDHGRFEHNLEVELFAKRGRMGEALDYAKHIIKDRLPQQIENFFILDAHEDDRPDLEEYLEFIKHGEKKSSDDSVAGLPAVCAG